MKIGQTLRMTVVVLLLLLAAGSELFAHNLTSDNSTGQTDTLANKKPTVKFYGLVRLYLMADTRGGNFFPPGVLVDDFGNDLNDVPNSTMMSGLTTLGLNITGPKLGRMIPEGRIECDFLGNTSADVVMRIRHAYMNLKWFGSPSSLLIGQTWHPFFDDVYPNIMYINDAGAFHPINRSPMLRYRYTRNGWTATAAAVYQNNTFSSYGPDGRNRNYLARAIVPELYAGVSWQNKKLFLGVGVSWISIRPRTSASVTVLNADGIEETLTRKVNERFSAVIIMAQARWKLSEKFTLQAKSFLGSNTGNFSILGGYGVSSEDISTGVRHYTAPHFSSTWIQGLYSHGRWLTGLFAGYSRNLGTGRARINEDYYGNGENVKQLTGAMLTVSYTMGPFMVGAEYLYCNAIYGKPRLEDGRFNSTSPVSNNRILLRTAYSF